MPTHFRTGLAPAYGILAFRVPDKSPTGLGSTATWLTGGRVLHLLGDQGGYVLIPADNLDTGPAFARLLQEKLPAPAWIGIAWRPLAELPAGRAEAMDVLTSAVTSRREPGCYQLDDVLVEYAVLRQPTASRPLVKLIRPVARNPVLLETLEALLSATGNLSRASAELAIHRSTLVYRLAQIERLTGHSPMSTRALQVLSAALTADTADKGLVADPPAWGL